MQLTNWKSIGIAGLAGIAIGLAAAWPVAASSSKPSNLPVVPSAQTTTGQLPAGITVGGEGEIKVAPDRANVTLGIQTQGKTAAEAMDAANQKMQAIVAKLKELKLPDNVIQTKNVSVSPQYSQRPPEGTAATIIGYQANNSVEVRIDDINRTGEIVDAAVNAGANQVQGIRFSLKDDSAIRGKAVEAAVNSARVDADSLAKALGVQLKGVQTVSIDSAPRTTTVDRAVAASPSFAAQVQPGEISYTVHVQVTYAIG